MQTATPQSSRTRWARTSYLSRFKGARIHIRLGAKALVPRFELGSSASKERRATDYPRPVKLWEQDSNLRDPLSESGRDTVNPPHIAEPNIRIARMTFVLPRRRSATELVGPSEFSCVSRS